jgi:hypothetical protein
LLEESVVKKQDVEPSTSSEITPIARQLYRHLVKIVRRGTASITYRDLAVAVSEKYPVHQRSPKLHSALTEVTIACRARELPAVTAIVWKARAHRPSDGYYEIAHPRARSWAGQLEAWKEEHARVLREAQDLPASL